MPDIQPSMPYNYSPPGDDKAETSNKESGGFRNIISTIALFLAAPLLALILIMFVIQSYEVDGPSMNNTLHNKDLLIVSKIPRTWARISHKPYVPPRGEIIIFSQSELSSSGTRQLVKRVIGLPGERVTVSNGLVTVYNQAHPEGFNPDKDQEYAKDFTDTPGSVDLTVKEGEVFVMGDNRHNSLDSRYFGAINDEQIVGKLGIRIFPLNKARVF